MKAMVVGHKGMLGSALYWALAHRGDDVIGVGSDSVVTGVVLQHMDVVFNCAGIVKQRSDYVPLTRMVGANGVLPHSIASLADAFNKRLIHVSTDCVFSTPGPHSESEHPSASDIYGASKLIGEVTHSPHLTIRTSFVGNGCRGLVYQLRNWPHDRLYEASTQPVWTGHTVEMISDILIVLGDRPDITGLLHVPGEEWSRAELVEALIGKLNLPVVVKINNHLPMVDRRLVSERWADLGLETPAPFRHQLSVASWGYE